jgi:hypothetical protein
MITPGLTRSLCLIPSFFLIGLAASFAQAPQVAAPAKPAAPDPLPSPLTVFVIEGNNAVNSIPLLRSVTPTVEVRDQNEFPVEGATVVFTMPEQGPGGRFAGDQLSFTTRSDVQGQASAPFVVNNLAGKFVIKVTATAGNRRGEASISQANSTGEYIGTAQPARHWYKKWYVWAIFGGAAAGGTIALTRGGSSGSTNIIFTPGGPVIGSPR